MFPLYARDGQAIISELKKKEKLCFASLCVQMSLLLYSCLLTSQVEEITPLLCDG